MLDALARASMPPVQALAATCAGQAPTGISAGPCRHLCWPGPHWHQCRPLRPLVPASASLPPVKALAAACAGQGLEGHSCGGFCARCSSQGKDGAGEGSSGRAQAGSLPGQAQGGGGKAAPALPQDVAGKGGDAVLPWPASLGLFRASQRLECVTGACPCLRTHVHARQGGDGAQALTPAVDLYSSMHASRFIPQQGSTKSGSEMSAQNKPAKIEAHHVDQNILQAQQPMPTGLELLGGHASTQNLNSFGHLV